jgi:hypothetical protein
MCLGIPSIQSGGLLQMRNRLVHSVLLQFQNAQMQASSRKFGLQPQRFGIFLLCSLRQRFGRAATGCSSRILVFNAAALCSLVRSRRTSRHHRLPHQQSSQLVV